jgi:hypothetical protein
MNKLIGIALLALAFANAGCEQKGPAERAGENIDQAASELRDGAADIRDKAEETTDKIADALEQPRGEDAE